MAWTLPVPWYLSSSGIADETHLKFSTNASTQGVLAIFIGDVIYAKKEIAN